VLLPALKPGQSPSLQADGSILMGARVYGHLTELQDESGLVWPLCALLDGTNDIDSLVRIMAADHGASAEQIHQILDLFRDCGWLTDQAASAPPGLTAKAIERHQRTLEFLSGVDTSPRMNPYELLAQLKRARAVVIGLGGAGSACAAGLVATGVGEIHLIDFDTVESSNLNRQLLFTEQDLGRAKIEAAAERLRAIDADVLVTSADRYLSSVADITGAISGADVVFGCADSPAQIDAWINEACYRAAIPWLTAGYAGARYSLGTFIPGQTACYSCLTAERRDVQPAQTSLPTAVSAISLGGVIAASSQIAGHAMALEGIYLLLGMPVQTAGRELHRHLTDYEFHYYLDARSRLDCPVGCGAMLSSA
jgi:molybdopterin-synthase adenylyltransferase